VAAAAVFAGIELFHGDLRCKSDRDAF